MLLRRLVWAPIALAGLLIAPAPVGSTATRGGSPKVHVAGIGQPGPGGGPRTAVPHLVRPGSDRRADVGGSRASAPRGGAPLAPTVQGIPFEGVPDLKTVSPGDPTGALGKNHHMAAVNVHMNFFDRLGNRVYTPHKRLRSLDTRLPRGATDFDPKVVYDPYRDAFLLVFASATTTRSFLTIVVVDEGAEASYPNGWCVLHMSGDQVSGNRKQFADYPMLGITANRVTLATNQFDYTSAPRIGRFRYVQVVSFRKSHLYDCSVPVVPIKVFSRNQTRDPDGSRAFTIVPAISDGGSRPKVQYMASMDFNGFRGKLILWRLRPVNGVLKLGRAQVSGGPMFYPRWGRQCGGTNNNLNTQWDTGDVRLTTGFWDAGRGRLYTATAIDRNIGGGPAESVVRWWEIDPASTLSNSRVTRRGIVGAAGRDAAWPSVATDAGGKLWVNYARAGLGECLSAYAAVVQPGARAASSVLIREGERRYEFSSGIERWGDYTAISRDPLDPNVMAAYGADTIDDGVGGSPTFLWQQVIATLRDV
jgi:hypothetical protein